MTQDAEGIWHDECDWCLADVVNASGPPSMSRVTAQAAPGQPRTMTWTICGECYVRLFKFMADVAAGVAV